MSTVRRWTGLEAHALRVALRLTVRAFAEYLGVAVRTVSKWEAGGESAVPRPDSQAILDTALGRACPDAQQRFESLCRPPARMATVEPVPPGSRATMIDALAGDVLVDELLADFGPRETGGVDSGDMCREPDVAVPVRTLDGGIVFVSVSRRLLLRSMGSAALAATAGAGQASEVVDTTPPAWNAELDPLAHFVEMKRVLMDSDNLFGSKQVAGTVERQLEIMQDLSGRWRGSDRDALVRLQAQFADLAGWLRQDGGDHDGAARWLDLAVQCAERDGDRRAEAFIMARQSQLAGDRRDGGTAIDAARVAARLAPPGSRSGAIARVYAAHGFALNGDHSSCMREFEYVRESLKALDDDPDFPYGLCFDETYVSIQEARSLTVLGRHRLAAEKLRESIELLPGTYRRDRGRLPRVGRSRVSWEPRPGSSSFAWRAGVGDRARDGVGSDHGRADPTSRCLAGTVVGTPDSPTSRLSCRCHVFGDRRDIQTSSRDRWRRSMSGTADRTGSDDKRWMKVALELSWMCPKSETAYSVGAVIVGADGEEISRGFSRETDEKVHAEESALLKVSRDDTRLRTATMYSTLEPCSQRASRPRACAQLILDAGIPRVVTAWREPSLFVADAQGTELLTAAGVTVVELDEFAKEALGPNAHLPIGRSA